LLKAVWQVLGQHEDWLSTAVKTSDPGKLSPIDRRPILVITEENDEQQKVGTFVLLCGWLQCAENDGGCLLDDFQALGQKLGVAVV
jgi:hypothetical protein